VKNFSQNACLAHKKHHFRYIFNSCRPELNRLEITFYLIEFKWINNVFFNKTPSAHKKVQAISFNQF